MHNAPLSAVAQVIDQFNIPAVKALFDETDFVGMSSYPSLSPRFTADQLENALWQFAREIKYFGVDLSKVCVRWLWLSRSQPDCLRVFTLWCADRVNRPGARPSSCVRARGCYRIAGTRCIAGGRRDSAVPCSAHLRMETVVGAVCCGFLSG